MQCCVSKFIIKVSFKRQSPAQSPRPPAVTERPLGRYLVQESNSLGVQTCTWTTTTRFGKQRASVRAVQPVKSSFRMHEVILYVWGL